MVLFSDFIHYKWTISISNLFCSVNILSALWILMVYYSSTRAVALTVLSIDPWTSSCVEFCNCAGGKFPISAQWWYLASNQVTHIEYAYFFISFTLHLIWYIVASNRYNYIIKTLRLRQKGHHFANNLFKCIFLNENIIFVIKISLKFISKGSFNNIPALDNGFALNRWQAIIWTIGGFFYWHIYVSLDLNELASGGRFKNTYELLNLRALKFSILYKIIIIQCMSKIFCVEFQREPLKLHTKYLSHTLKNFIFIQNLNFKSS